MFYHGTIKVLTFRFVVKQKKAKSMKKLLIGSALCALTLYGASTPAHAEDKGFQAGSFLVRGRLIDVIPQEDSSTTVAGGTVGVGNRIAPELDFSYFFSPNIASELILATTKHELEGKGSLTGTKIGSAWIVPPTLTLQYHFMPDQAFKPYVGAGVNYSWFWNEKPSASFNKLSMTGGFGYALQAGFDYKVADNLYLNADVKKIKLNVDASLNSGATKADVDLDPWVVGFGVGYKF